MTSPETKLDLVALKELCTKATPGLTNLAPVGRIEDYHFAIAARTVLPQLIAENERLERELAEAKKEIRVAAAVIEQDGLVRIFRRGGNDSYTGKWEFPGGKLEPGETPEEALRRELQEEFAVDSEIGPALDHYWYKYPKRQPISLTFFAAKLLAAPEFIEHTESAWVRPDQLSGYDLMNADMVFVAIRYVAIRACDQAREQRNKLAGLLREVVSGDVQGKDLQRVRQRIGAALVELEKEQVK